MVLQQGNLKPLILMAKEMRETNNPRIHNVLNRIKKIMKSPSDENLNLLQGMCEIHAQAGNFNVIMEFINYGLNPSYLTPLTCLCIQTEDYYIGELLKINIQNKKEEVHYYVSTIKLLKDLQEKIANVNIDWQMMSELCLKQNNHIGFYGLKRALGKGVVLTQDFCEKVVENKNIWVADLLDQLKCVNIEMNSDKTFKKIVLIKDRLNANS